MDWEMHKLASSYITYRLQRCKQHGRTGNSRELYHLISPQKTPSGLSIVVNDILAYYFVGISIFYARNCLLTVPFMDHFSL